MKCNEKDCKFNPHGICLAPNPNSCIIPKRGWPKVQEQTFQNWEKFGYNGVTSLPFCPGCMMPLLTFNENLKMAKAFSQSKISKVEHIISNSLLRKAVGFAFYVPRNEKMANLLNHRVIVHPFCRECFKHTGKKEFEETVERNLALSRRFLPHAKIKVNRS